MKPARRLSGYIALLGVLTFVGVVVWLHLVERDYDPAYQLMSELALTSHGAFMALAFLGFSAACFAVSWGLGGLVGAAIPRVLLLVAALCLAGAGWFRLGQYDVVHISLVATAFLNLVLAMCAFARTAAAAGFGAMRQVSWFLAAATSCAIAAGHALMPMGVAQRLGAAFVLAWLAVVAVRLVTRAGLGGNGA